MVPAIWRNQQTLIKIESLTGRIVPKKPKIGGKEVEKMGIYENTTRNRVKQMDAIVKEHLLRYT